MKPETRVVLPIEAFWVKQGYLRDITAGDLELLTPVYDDPLRDPIFALPAPGPVLRPASEQATQPRQPTSASVVVQQPKQDEQPIQDLESQPKPVSTPGARSLKSDL